MRDVASATYGAKEDEAPKKVSKVEYPSYHQPGMTVPKGGSMCQNCRFLGKDKLTCTSQYFIKWHGSNVIPAPIDEYCSDWYERR